jgi:death-on-curing family protein
MNQIEIYKAKDGQTQIEVQFEEDTVWLTQKQIGELFHTSTPNANMHISNITEKSVIKNFLITAADGKKYRTKHYNLDMIISVGYRINSKRGTQFRQWATQRLKDYLVTGYALNEKRLQQVSQNMRQLQDAIKLIEQSGNSGELTTSEAKGLLEIITNYTQSFILLNQFDSNNLSDEQLNENITYEIDYSDAIKAIGELKKQLMKKKEASKLFGNQKDKSFAGILNSVVQTFDKKYLYPSIEEQAAHLLYFVIKNHPFTDGNKRIGAFLFVWFLEKNKHRFKRSGELKINDNALVALALLVAQSNPDDKQLMVKLIINLVNNR